MPRKGRLVQPRHIFPWIAAPYIEMLRILWRIEGFFLLPIKYLRAWTVSAIIGVLGVIFSIALFIPRLAETQVQASPDPKPRLPISNLDFPEILDKDQVLPSGYQNSNLDVRFRQLSFRDYFDQNKFVTTISRPVRRSIPLNYSQIDEWRPYRNFNPRPQEPLLDSYILAASVWRDPRSYEPQEYIYDPQASATQNLATSSPHLFIEKNVPTRHSPHEPLISRIYVTNNGVEPIASAIVRESVSDITRVINCVPPAMRTADSQELVWNLLGLQPRETRELTITIQPDINRNISETTEVEFTSAAVIAETMIRERPVAPVEPEVVPEQVRRPKTVGKPQLVLDFEPPQIVKVGEEVKAYYTITNIGTADATGIRLLVEVPANLRHRFGELVEHKISRLAPNESRRALFAALAEGSGRMPLHWTLEAAELADQSESEWLTIAASPEPAATPQPAPVTSPVNGANPTLRSTIPPSGGLARPNLKSTVPAKSSIPRNEPSSLEEPDLGTPTEAPLPDNVAPENLPEEAPKKPLAPSLSSDVPPAAFGPRPLTEPSSLPSLVYPELGQEPIVPADPLSTQPIEPEMAPDEVPGLNAPDLQLNDLGGRGEQPPAFPSTIPAEERTDGARPQ